MSKGRSILHHATRADYEPVFADVSAQLPTKYAINEWRLDSEYRLYASPLEAPDFGSFKFGWYPGTMFFVLPADAALPFGYWPEREVPEKYGPIPSIVGNSPDYRWVYFNSSGFHNSEKFGQGLIQGWLATNSNHHDSMAIFDAFKKSMKKRFEYFRSGMSYVGPEAAKYFESGGRLTEDLRASVTRDIKRS